MAFRKKHRQTEPSEYDTGHVLSDVEKAYMNALGQTERNAMKRRCNEVTSILMSEFEIEDLTHEIDEYLNAPEEDMSEFFLVGNLLTSDFALQKIVERLGEQVQIPMSDIYRKNARIQNLCFKSLIEMFKAKKVSKGKADLVKIFMQIHDVWKTNPVHKKTPLDYANSNTKRDEEIALKLARDEERRAADFKKMEEERRKYVEHQSQKASSAGQPTLRDIPLYPNTSGYAYDPRMNPQTFYDSFGAQSPPTTSFDEFYNKNFSPYESPYGQQYQPLQSQSPPPTIQGTKINMNRSKDTSRNISKAPSKTKKEKEREKEEEEEEDEEGKEKDNVNDELPQKTKREPMSNRTKATETVAQRIKARRSAQPKVSNPAAKEAYERNSKAREEYRDKAKDAIQRKHSEILNSIRSNRSDVDKRIAAFKLDEDTLDMNIKKGDMVSLANKYKDNHPSWSMPTSNVDIVGKRVNYWGMFLIGVKRSCVYLSTMNVTDPNVAMKLFISLGVCYCRTTRSPGKIGDFVLDGHDISMQEYISYLSYVFDGIDTDPKCLTINRHAISCSMYAAQVDWSFPFGCYAPNLFLEEPENAAAASRVKEACVKVDSFLANAGNTDGIAFVDQYEFNMIGRPTSRPILPGFRELMPDHEMSKAAYGKTATQLMEEYETAIRTKDINLFK